MDKHLPSFLFQHPTFIFRNAESSIVTFENQKAKIYFSQVNNSLLSLQKAPFGSFILKPGAKETDLISLLKEIQEWSTINHVENLVIRSFPDIYAPDDNSLIKSVLLEFGFTIKYQDVTQVLPITAGQEMGMDTHKKRRLRKSRSAGFTFRQVTPDFLKESYSLIVESRKNKDYPVTMTAKELEAMFVLFPQDCLLFGVFDKSKMIATSVSIKINPQILYCFYIGDSLAYRPYSPVTLLIRGIYDFCAVHRIKFLDMGLSTDRGILNKGLYVFKKSFGCFDSYKLTFEKQL